MSEKQPPDELRKLQIAGVTDHLTAAMTHFARLKENANFDRTEGLHEITLALEWLRDIK